MSVHIYRYGECRELPGLSIGVTRQAPRGVRREERAARGFFDTWLPMLGPTPELLAEFRNGQISFPAFRKRYRTEMKRPEPRQVISLLASVAKSRRINLGCYCEDPARCHRSLLRELIEAELHPAEGECESDHSTPGYASPACYAAEFADELFPDGKRPLH
jgi:uncharacterized protein YeaO (DUF488 family)